MSAGRRGLILSVAFLTVAWWLCPGQQVHAQKTRVQQIQPGMPNRPIDPGAGQHRIWNSELSPDQIRNKLLGFNSANAEADEVLLALLRNLIGAKNPDAKPEQVDAAAKKLLNDKEFRDRIMDLAQKHKNQNPRPNNFNPDQAPKLTRDEIAKLIQVAPDNVGKGDPFTLPKDFDPNGLAPFDPKNPNFDPKKFPHINPKNPPEFDKNTGFPLDPDTGKPFDPRNGQPIDPKNPPKIEPTPPKFDPNDPAQPPKIEPKNLDPMPKNPDPGNPPPPPNKDDNRKFDPDNPLGVPKDSPERLAKTKAVETATALWEKNVGPIEDSPEVKRALIDLVNDPDAMNALTDSKGNNIFEFFQQDTGDGEKLGDWFKSDEGSSWEWPKFDLGWSRGRDVDIGADRDRGSDRWSSDSSSRSRGSSSTGGMGSFDLGSMQVPWLLVLIILALIVAAVVWWKWGNILQPRAAAATALGSGGGWPIDPREINTREDVVKAFEYLSVMLCGPGAKTWTHSTIADELSELAASDPGIALKLARLYELARYAPLDEPLTRAELLEARRLVCELAGMDEA